MWRGWMHLPSLVSSLLACSPQRVIITSVPKTAESYIHLIGRTGRKGSAGTASNIYTEKELNAAGFITHALHGVKFRMLQWCPRVKRVEPWSPNTRRTLDGIE